MCIHYSFILSSNVKHGGATPPYMWWYYDKANDKTDNEHFKVVDKMMSYRLELPPYWYDDS